MCLIVSIRGFEPISVYLYNHLFVDLNVSQCMYRQMFVDFNVLQREYSPAKFYAGNIADDVGDEDSIRSDIDWWISICASVDVHEPIFVQATL